MSIRLVGVALTFISNPFVLAAIGVGALGYTLLSDKGKSEENSGSDTVPNGTEPSIEPLKRNNLTVQATATEPFKATESTVGEAVNPAVEKPLNSREFKNFNSEPQQTQAPNEENLKNELIRQAMSELGKRSAAARARKKGAC